MTIAPDKRLHLAIGAVTALVMTFNLVLFVALGPLIAILAATIEIAGGWAIAAQRGRAVLVRCCDFRCWRGGCRAGDVGAGRDLAAKANAPTRGALCSI